MKRTRVIGGTEGFASPRRCGAILVFAMIALLVVSLIGASMMQSAVMVLRQLQKEHWRLQADWLVDAGSQRARLRSQLDAGYSGEEWIIPAARLQSASDAVVQISVSPGSGTAAGQIQVVAEYPRGNPQLVRVRRTLVFPRSRGGKP